MTMHALTIFVEGCINMLLTKRLFCMFMNLIRAQKKKEKEKPRPISSHLDRKSLVNKGFIILLFGFQRNLSRGTQRVVPSGQDGSILPAHGTSHIIKWFIAPATKPIKTPELHYLMIQLLKVWFFLHYYWAL